MPLTKAEARKVLLSVPGTSEGPHYGKPAIFYRAQFVSRVHDKEDAVVILTGSIEMRDVMLEAEPELFYITDHYRKWPALLARLSVLNTRTLKSLIAPRIKAIDDNPGKNPPRKKKAKQAVKKKAVRRS
jgi:hypothetical protein